MTSRNPVAAPVGRHRRLTFSLLAVALSVVMIVAAPAVMGPAYRHLSAACGAMTVWVVEVLFALFIDIPLTAVFIALYTVLCGAPRNAARAALGFVAIFFGLILATIAASPLHPVLADLALSDTFGVAMQRSLHELGMGTHVLFAILFLAFDLTLCAAGGLVGRELAEPRTRV